MRIGKTALVSAGLACTCLGLRLQASLQHEKSQSGLERLQIATSPVTALVAMLLAYRLENAFHPHCSASHASIFNPIDVISRPVGLDRHLCSDVSMIDFGKLNKKKPEKRKGRPLVPASRSETRIMPDFDPDEQGPLDSNIWTQSEFKEYYGDLWEEKWEKALPAVGVKGVDQLRVGQEVSACVTIKEDWALFCDIGAQVQGRLRARHISPTLFNQLVPGDRLFARIQSIDIEKQQVNIEAYDQQNVADLDEYEVGSVVFARITHLISRTGAICAVGGDIPAFLAFSKFWKRYSPGLRAGSLVKARITSLSTNPIRMFLVPCDLGTRKPIVDVKVGDSVDAVVVGVGKHVATCDIGTESYARLERWEICNTLVTDMRRYLREGDTVKARVVHVDPQLAPYAGVQISCRDPAMYEGGFKFSDLFKSTSELLGDYKYIETMRPGQRIIATVVRTAPFGVYCTVGRGLKALVHHADASDKFVSDLSTLFQTHDKFEAQIKQVDLENQRVILRCHRLPERDKRETPVESDRVSLDNLYTGQEVRGTVRTVMDWGVFVDIGATKNALLQIGPERLSRDKLSVGDTIAARIKVLDLGTERLEIT